MSSTPKFLAPEGKGSFNQEITARLLEDLRLDNASSARLYPGDKETAQPVHTVYGGANLFKRDSSAKLEKLALKALDTFAPNWVVLARALKLPGHESLPVNLEQAAAYATAHDGGISAKLYSLVREKLQNGAVQDLRIDFEDGYGYRSDEEEDKHAESAAIELAAAITEGSCPPFIGIRVKPLTNELAHRSVRTLDIFITSLMKRIEKLPANFVVTLPKVSSHEQVGAMCSLLSSLELSLGLDSNAIMLELMVETPQAIIASNGTIALRKFASVAGPRLRGMHFGTYDYTASLGIAGHHQSMDHPACDFARQVMLSSLSGTGIWLSDGATVKMPIAPHKAAEGANLSALQEAENIDAVHKAWQLSFDNIRASLRLGFYQGWDLHPAQFVSRYAALYYFFLQGMDECSERLRAFMNKAAQATLSGNSFDDAATGQGLLNFMLKALACGAITEEQLQKRSGLSLEELRSRSFAAIVAGRTKS